MKKYKIIGEHVEGISTVGYVAEGKSDGDRINIKRHDLISMAKRGLIENVKLLVGDNGSYYLEFDEEINEVERLGDTFKVICRILEKTGDGDVCVGYILKSSKGKTYKTDIGDAWELAYQGKLDGLRGVIIANKKTIISNSDDDKEQLIKLPTIYK